LPGTYYPLPPGEIQRRCSNLLQRQKLRLEGVYVYETEKQLAIVSAYATGLGPKRRIWLTDSLLKRFRPDEIEVIVAHEFAHHLHGDLSWRLALSLLLPLAWLLLWQLMIAFQFLLSSEFGLAALIVALFAFWLDYRLLLNSIVYRQEMRADRFALEQTGDVRAYQNAMIRLANLSPASGLGGRTERPRNRSYPSLVKRLAQADLLRLQQQERAGRADLPWQESVG
jgi:Zn-dependent protease with chaperone function